MLTLDTSGLVALIGVRDLHHSRALDVLDVDPGPYFIPVAILSELAYLLERRVGSRPVLDVLDDLESGAFTADCGQQDFPRIRDLMERYDDLGLGLADAAVIACAERHRGRVLTFDRRDFDVVAREGKITVLPA